MSTPLTTSAAHTSKDIRDYLITLITLNGYYSVDEQSYIHVTSTGDKVPYPFTTPAEGTPTRYFSVYDVSQQNSDVYPFNPYVEGLTVSASQQWFFSMMTMTMGSMLRNIMMTILKECLDTKNSKSKTSTDDTTTAILIAPFLADPIDTKCITELEYITTKMFDFFNIYFSRKQNHSTVTLGVFEPGFKKKFTASRLRERSLELFRKMIRYILSVEDDPRKELATGPVQRGCAHFDSYMRLFNKLLRKMEKFLYMQKITVDIPYLEAMSDRCGEFWCTAKNFIVNTAPPVPDAQSQPSVLNHSVSVAASIPSPFDNSQAAAPSPLVSAQRTIECAVPTTPPAKKVEAVAFGQAPQTQQPQQPAGYVAPENLSPMLQQPNYAVSATAPIPGQINTGQFPAQPYMGQAPQPMYMPQQFPQNVGYPYSPTVPQNPYQPQMAAPMYSAQPTACAPMGYPYQTPTSVAPTPTPAAPQYVPQINQYGQQVMVPVQAYTPPQPPTEVYLQSTGGVAVSAPIDVTRIAAKNPLLG